MAAQPTAPGKFGPFGKSGAAPPFGAAPINKSGAAPPFGSAGFNKPGSAPIPSAAPFGTAPFVPAAAPPCGKSGPVPAFAKSGAAPPFGKTGAASLSPGFGSGNPNFPGVQSGAKVNPAVNQEECERLRVSVEEARLGLDNEKQKKEAEILKGLQSEEEKLVKQFEGTCSSVAPSFGVSTSTLDNRWAEAVPVAQSLYELANQPLPQARPVPAQSSNSAGALKAMQGETDQIVTEFEQKVASNHQPVSDLITNEATGMVANLGEIWNQFNAQYETVKQKLESVKARLG